MKLATPVPIEWIPTEREFMPTQSFKFTADTGRFLVVTVRHGLKSFGDYPLAKDYSEVVGAPAFPPAVKIISEGSVLSLSGEKKISILTRNVPAIQIEVSRLLPGYGEPSRVADSGHFFRSDFLETVRRLELRLR